MTRVAAGIVTFDPNPLLLKKVIAAVHDQVDLLFIVDNASLNRVELRRVASAFWKVHLVENQRNAGVAQALNQVLGEAERLQCRWVLTLDQDSIVPAGMVQKLLSHAHRERVGIICPLVEDRNLESPRAHTSGVREVNECITAGSLTSVTAWSCVGGFDESMFIDLVDFDFCLSLRKMRFSIVRVQDVWLSHEVGKSRSVRFLCRKLVAFNHAPPRRYFFARNLVYFTRKHRGSVNPLRMYATLVERTLITLVFEESKWAKLQATARGVRDGMSMPTPSKQE